MARACLALCISMLLLCCSLSLNGQVSTDSLSSIRFQFFRQNNFTYNSLLETRYIIEKENYGLRLHLSHSNIYNSLRRENSFVQFYFQGHLWQHWKINAHLALLSWFESKNYFDSKNHRISLYAGIEYRFRDLLSIKPLVGFSWDFRNGVLDQGISPALLLKGRYQWPDGLQMETRIFARGKYILPRHQRNIHMDQDWASSFGEQAQIAFGFSLGSNELDTYKGATVQQIRADTFAVERLLSDTVSPYIRFRYQIFPGLSFDSDNRFGFTRRKFAYKLNQVENDRFNDLSFIQTDISTSNELSFTRKKINLSLRYAYEFLRRRYDLENTVALPEPVYNRLLQRERLKDYFRNRHSLLLNLVYRFNDKNQLILNGFNRYLQFDTPTEGNFDDYDLLQYGMSLAWQKTWSRRFITEYKLTGSLRQYAFLFSQRSQDNYTQRNLRLEFDFRWNPLPKLSIEGKQWIYINYNVKDFEDINQTDRSVRNLESLVELVHRPSEKVRQKVYVYRKETHVAYLNWAKFAETPLDTNRIYILEYLNEWKIKEGKKNVLFLDLGYKHFSQTRRFNTSMNNLENILTPINLQDRSFQSGPKTQFRWMRNNPSSMELSVWWQFQIQEYTFKEVERFTSLLGNYKEENLLERSIFFRPFVQLSMNISI